MANSRGRNAGATGLIDLPGLGAKFEVRAYGYQQKLALSSKQRKGRTTTGKWAGSRPLTAGGGMAVSGKMRFDGSLLPSDWRGQEGTITLTYAAGKTETVPVRVEGMSNSFDEKSEDLQDVTLSCAIIGLPTFAGFGTPPAATDPAKSDDNQWEGTSKTKDPNGLQSASMTMVDVWGSLANTDTAEATRLASVIGAAVVPQAGMKLRYATFVRDSDDGGTVQITWGLTDTVEDVVNPITVTTIDPKGLQSQASTAAINATPPTPTGAAFKLRGTSTQELNDSNILKKADFGLTDTAEDVINAATETTIDPQGLASHASTAAINGTPPSAGIGFKVRGTTTQELNDGNILQKSEQGLRDTKDDVEMEGTHTKADPFQLEPGGQITVVLPTATPPTVPAAPTPGAVYVDTLTRQLVPGMYSHTFLFGPRTSADDAILPHTWTLADPGDLDSEGEVAAIGVIPTVPSPYYNRGVTGHYLTSGKLLYVMKFGRRSTVQDHEMTHTVSTGTPFGGIETSFATVINNPAGVDFITAANYSTAVNFGGVSCRRLNDAKAMLIQTIRDNPRIIIFQERSASEAVQGYVDGGSVYVYVRQKFQRANGWEFELALQPMEVLRMRFGVRKRVTGTTIDMQEGLAGQANNNPFLGRIAGSVTYRGINGEHNYSNGGPAEIFYQCEFFSVFVGGVQKAGHIAFNKASLGWHFSTNNLSSVTAGTWVKASTLADGSTSFDAAPLPTADFSGLLT